jgi:hypothetical protein
MAPVETRAVTKTNCYEKILNKFFKFFTDPSKFLSKVKLQHKYFHNQKIQKTNLRQRL